MKSRNGFSNNDEKKDSTMSGTDAGGVVYGNVSNASTFYGADKFSTPRGHGFAAEQANHLYDKVANMDFWGQDKVRLVGEDIDPQTGRIIKNGADRIVNGTNIQTKYCKTGGKCISECFENGKFRYLNPDGTPMKVEVPSDKYDAAVQAMENRIKNGEVPGILDPKDAGKIIRKGHFTYEQAKNIAKAGTIESVSFDAVNGVIVSSGAMGVSAIMELAISVWNGESFDVAVEKAVHTGLKVGGVSFVTAILASQLSKAGLNSALVNSSEAIVRVMGLKASAVFVNAFRSGKNIYGAAAMKSASKMLRGNAITGVVSVAVCSSVDVVNIFRGRISGKQLFKNVANTAATVAGGTAGWAGGAAAGAALGSVVPGIGTAIGGAVGGIIGSFAAGAASSKLTNGVLGTFIEDDAEEMVRIIEKVFQELADDYLLNEKEAKNIVDRLSGELTGGTLENMFASSDRRGFARDLLIKHVEKEVRNRKRIVLPSVDEMQKGLRKVLEDIADVAENEIVDELTMTVKNGIMCFNNKDYGKAVEYFRIAANKGNVSAQYKLGCCYAEGLGVKKDISYALDLYKAAAEQDYAPAQAAIGHLLGWCKDELSAIKRYKKATECGALDNVIIQGDIVKLNQVDTQMSTLTDQMINEYNVGKYVDAFKHFMQAAEQGDSIACYWLGKCYANGKGVAMNKAAAIGWYGKAAVAGYSVAQTVLGNCYYMGDGTERNYSEAIKWYKKAVEQGDSVAQCNLASCYYNGYGVEKDKQIAYDLYELASAQGNRTATKKLQEFKW